MRNPLILATLSLISLAAGASAARADSQSQKLAAKIQHLSVDRTHIVASTARNLFHRGDLLRVKIVAKELSRWGAPALVFKSVPVELAPNGAFVVDHAAMSKRGNTLADLPAFRAELARYSAKGAFGDANGNAQVETMGLSSKLTGK